MELRHPGKITIIGLLALLPAIIFVVSRADLLAGITAINVLLITVSFFLMLGGRTSSVARSV